MQTLKAVLFDLDGTLVDSYIDFSKMKKRIIKILEFAGVEEGFLLEDMLVYEIEKRAKNILEKNGFSKSDIQNIFRKVNKVMKEIELEAVGNSNLIQNTRETLNNLKQRGLKLGIISRGCREYVIQILRKFELKPFIDAVVARDDVSKPKPDPEHPRFLMRILDVKPSETILVGDHLMDAQCAEKSGIKCFIVKGRKNNFKKIDYVILQNIKDLTYILPK